MSFPLPTGVCRVVCRPKRSPARVTGINEAIRMAKAAVRNGDDPCDVAKGVAAAVGCEAGLCATEQAQLDIGLQALTEDIEAVIEAFLSLLYIVVGDRPDFRRIPGPEKTDSWVQKLLTRLRMLLRNITLIFYIRDVVEAILNLWDALLQLVRTAEGVVKDGYRLLGCLKLGE